MRHAVGLAGSQGRRHQAGRLVRQAEDVPDLVPQHGAQVHRRPAPAGRGRVDRDREARGLPEQEVGKVADGGRDAREVGGGPLGEPVGLGRRERAGEVGRRQGRRGARARRRSHSRDQRAIEVRVVVARPEVRERLRDRAPDRSRSARPGAVSVLRKTGASGVSAAVGSGAGAGLGGAIDVARVGDGQERVGQPEQAAPRASSGAVAICGAWTATGVRHAPVPASSSTSGAAATGGGLAAIARSAAGAASTVAVTIGPGRQVDQLLRHGRWRRVRAPGPPTAG